MSGHGKEKGFAQTVLGGVVIIALTVIVCGGIFIAMLMNSAH